MNRRELLSRLSVAGLAIPVGMLMEKTLVPDLGSAEPQAVAPHYLLAASGNSTTDRMLLTTWFDIPARTLRSLQVVASDDGDLSIVQRLDLTPMYNPRGFRVQIISR